MDGMPCLACSPACGGAAASSLESPTKLDRARVGSRPAARWVLTLYPGAGEAGGCLYGEANREGASGWSGLEPERSASEGDRRARGHVRRYCAANRLNRLGTLTYGPPFCRDARRVREDVRWFFRRLRRRTGPLAYLWVPELHADGERYHVHFAVGRYVHRGWIVEAWPHGFVHIKLLGDLPVGSGTLGEARAAGRYLGKYVSKSLGGGGAGLHRYEVAQGFQPERQRLTGPTMRAVLAEASSLMGSAPEHVWDSAGEEGWQGPHAVWASWAG